MATLDGSLNRKTDFQPAYHAGIYLTAWMGRVIALQPEILYSAQGTKFGLTPTGPTDNNLRIATLQLPALLKVYLGGRHFYLAAGPQVSLLLNAKEVLKSGTSSVTEDVKARYKSGDFSAVGALGAEVSRLVFDARLIYGFSDINNDPLEAATRAYLGIGGLHHRLFQVSMGIRLL